MKTRRNQEGSDAESSDDEQIIELPMNDFIVEDENADDENELELFENSQELTQIVPRNNSVAEADKPSKKKKRKESLTSTSHSYNGHRVREIDTSEIPDHIIANLKRVVPNEKDISNEDLSVEAIQKACSSSKDGVWILKCPLDVNLPAILNGKKFSLDGEQSVIKTEDDDNAQLTQYLPTNALGVNVKSRQFEVTSVTTDDYKHGAAFLIPDVNKFKLVSAPIQGHILIRERVEDLEHPKIKTPKLKARKLPAGIKERHPVYGADFTKILNEMESAPKKKRKTYFDPEVEFNFSKIEDESETNTLGRKKKKKDKSFEMHSNEICANGFDEDDSGRKKKSKKRKREELEDSYTDLNKTILIEDCEPEIKKRKKSKHKTSHY